MAQRLAKRRLEVFGFTIRGASNDALPLTQNILAKGWCGVRQFAPLVRLMGSCNTWLDCREVQLDQVIKMRLGQ
ncbi:hypothetical protein D3C78_1116130 [compost metagenome]